MKVQFGLNIDINYYDINLIELLFWLVSGNIWIMNFPYFLVLSLVIISYFLEYYRQIFFSGTRYGASIRKSVKKLEESSKVRYFCTFCGKVRMSFVVLEFLFLHSCCPSTGIII